MKEEKIKKKVIHIISNLRKIYLVLFFVFIFVLILLIFYLLRISEENKLKLGDMEIRTALLESEKDDYFSMEIEKINLSAPIVPEVSGLSRNEYDRGLQSGVAHLRGTAFPGGGDNIFIFGHSSSNIGSGPYSEVFKKLDDLGIGDEITISYEGGSYQYSIFDKEIVDKEEVSITRPTADERLTIMTCWPIGTDEKRLVVKARLINI